MDNYFLKFFPSVTYMQILSVTNLKYDCMCTPNTQMRVLGNEIMPEFL